jgi:hypothetical protein
MEELVNNEPKMEKRKKEMLEGFKTWPFGNCVAWMQQFGLIRTWKVTSGACTPNLSILLVIRGFKLQSCGL